LKVKTSPVSLVQQKKTDCGTAVSGNTLKIAVTEYTVPHVYKKNAKPRNKDVS